MAPGALLKLDDYRQVAPRGTVDFLMRIGERLRGKRLVHVSASRYGPLAESLNRVVPILSDLGVETTWEITIGTADFDQVGRAVAKGLAGTEQVITEAMLGRLRETGVDNARRLRLDADLVMVHDAPPLGLVEQRGDAARWVWRCHHDLSSAQPQLWNALRPMVQRYDAAVFAAVGASPVSLYLLVEKVNQVVAKAVKVARSNFKGRISYGAASDLEQMPNLLAAATIVVSRAGMGTLTELAALGKPSLIVPLPGSHQWANARAFEQLGAIDVADQAALTPNSLADRILTLLSDGPHRHQLQQAFLRSMPRDAAERIAAVLVAA